ncbi:MAG: LTA synthase family protein [Clostridiales Family XIII bacterium]|nr:LTA synthase family protein [Clostridiales Family XIII bacterium]
MVFEYIRRRLPLVVVSSVCLLTAAPLLHYMLQCHILFPDFMSTHPKLFAYGTLVLLLLMIAVSAIVGNAFLGASITGACIILLGYADRMKYLVRMEHVFPDDLIWFFRADELIGMSDTSELPTTFLLMGAALAPGVVATIILWRRKRRGGTKGDGSVRRLARFRRIVPRLLILGVSVGALVVVTLPIRSPYLGSLEPIDYQYIAWNQIWNYERNGYIAAFVSNLKYAGMEEPDGYTEEAIGAIVDKYRAVADKENKNRVDLSSEDIDVVYVMNESFCDPDRFTEYYPFKGPSLVLTPNLKAVQAKSAYGTCYSPRYGGGTANIEFEALTGFSTYYLGWAYPYQSMLPKMDSFPSVGRVLTEQGGYHSVGLHPYGATMYRRNVVYPIMGYDEFHGLREFRHTAHEGGSTYVSDKAAYAEVQDYLEKDDGANTFVTLVTMENHPQYGKQYSTHAFTSEAEGVDYLTKQKIDDYMSLIHSSDAALGEFIDWVDARERKTVVVFWGDHLPGVYDKLFDEEEHLGYETPFFIYSNFMDNTEDLGSVSPNQITPMFFDYLDAQKTPWDYLLDDVREDTPILTARYWDEKEAPAGEALDAYRLIQYDVMEGEGWSRDMGLFSIE